MDPKHSHFYRFLLTVECYSLAATLDCLISLEAEELRTYRGLTRHRSNVVACEKEAGRYYDDDILRELEHYRTKPEPSDILDNRRTGNAWAVAHEIVKRGLSIDAQIEVRAARAAERINAGKED